MPKNNNLWRRVCRLSDAELDVLADGDDDLALAASEELDLRIAARGDSRVAQGLGLAVGEQPS